MHSPQSTNLTYLKHLLRYLKEQLPMASILNATQISLTTYSDVDWASSTSDCRSAGGFLIYLGSSLISWSSKKQPTVAIDNASTELIWINSLLRKLQISLPALILWCDNIGATYLLANPMCYAQMKHTEVDFHFVHEQVAA
ncbi:unnamed protein product [Spirodela intermedia]|uniref:Uncharacterized protein n=1 Tax=Spirodela intermedia TaxID=51605 RepID=A0A7I8IT45_SPIIN|nr:unnamed protein product [Spirodela intermedia]CAA6661181.1 unnamed protein product [Spirodela intermedia]